MIVVWPRRRAVVYLLETSVVLLGAEWFSSLSQCPSFCYFCWLCTSIVGAVTLFMVICSLTYFPTSIWCTFSVHFIISYNPLKLSQLFKNTKNSQNVEGVWKKHTHTQKKKNNNNNNNNNSKTEWSLNESYNVMVSLIALYDIGVTMGTTV